VCVCACVYVFVYVCVCVCVCVRVCVADVCAGSACQLAVVVHSDAVFRGSPQERRGVPRGRGHDNFFVVIALRPQTPKHIRSGWSHYTDTSEE
jgi:hypothetical protein